MKKLHELPRQEVERIFNAAPFVVNLGIRLVSLGSGICESELDVEPRHLQQDGFVHAGVQATIVHATKVRLTFIDGEKVFGAASPPKLITH